ncbi:hypothetical protein NDU88_001429 [Pleurodeles waltl]|uniref:Uncharacterized protein n=1 Tax=Pleurodeles waltl TaxID=8319 RepID=A0AAV7L9J0_PLEWA|nr:hypothetical protein NDU88_001429 [Pleurodeles waltl]
MTGTANCPIIASSCWNFTSGLTAGTYVALGAPADQATLVGFYDTNLNAVPGLPIGLASLPPIVEARL